MIKFPDFVHLSAPKQGPMAVPVHKNNMSQPTLMTTNLENFLQLQRSHYETLDRNCAFTLASRQLPPGGVSRTTSLGCSCCKNRKRNHQDRKCDCCRRNSNTMHHSDFLVWPCIQARHPCRGGAKTSKTDACRVSRMPEMLA